MQAQPEYKIRVFYSVTNRARFLSHKEIIRFLTRAIRRAGFPIKYSQGFHPRVLLSFGPSRSVGLASTSEIFDMRLSEDCEPQKIQTELQKCFPENIKIEYVQKISEKQAAISAINSADYECEFPEILEDMPEKIKTVFQKKELLVNRSKEKITKIVNIRPGILEIKSNANLVKLCLGLTPELTVKPQEVLKELTGWSDDKLREICTTRTALNPCSKNRE